MSPANLLLGAVFAVMACSTASARIGETFEQCVARYGAPDSGPETDEDDSAARVYYFIKSGRDIRVVFYDGKAVDLFYSRLDKRAFSDSEVQKILAENKASEWVEGKAAPGKRSWESSQGGRHAFLTSDNKGTPKAFFTVWTAERNEKAYSGNEASSDPLKRALDGAETAIHGLRDLLGY